MTLASLFRTRSVRVVSAFLVLMGALVLVPGGETADAAGDPNVSMSKSAPVRALAGDPAIPITLTATNSSGTDGFNLTFVDVLQPGVSFVSSDPAPSQILSNTPHAGETTLVWRNIADLQAGVTQSLTYTIDAGTLPVGSTITNSPAGHTHLASAHVNRDPRVVPTYNTATDVVDNSDGYDSSGASTSLVAFILEKTEPNAEGELLRGLHDHQTVYTFEIRNNHLAATNDFAIEDWIPAGMEFLGCGTDDNSSGLEPGSSEAINAPGNRPPMSNPCVAPSLVETIETDPPGSLPFGVYTHVVWDIASLNTSLGISATTQFDYVAAIPLSANVLWSDPAVTVAEPPTTGEQGSNVDNNQGSSTQETGTEITMSNTAVASGTYTGNSTRYSDTDTMDVSSEDLSIHKSADQGSITHGIGTAWTLTVETSEYVGAATNLVVTDTIPDGLDFASAVPSEASVVAGSGGTLVVTWNLADMGPSDTTTITLNTTARSTYRATGAPVLANDSWTNSVVLDGTVDGRAVEDVSSDGQSAGPVSIVKEVATRVDPMNSCGDGSALTWNAVQADDYRIGDRVCWRLGVDFPVDLDTFDSDIQDYLPPGHQFTTADAWDYGNNNTVAPADITGPGAGSGETLLTWTVGDGGGYVAESLYFEVVFSSTIVDADATSSGEIVENLMKYSWENTAGTPFNLRDLADVEVLEAELDLLKGVGAVNTVSTGGNNVDGVEVQEDDVITYQLTITNSGDIDANDVEVWDLLPPEYDACATNVISISNSGSCAAARRIEWTGLTVPANGSIAVTYDVIFPSGIAPNETIPNDAGVRSYTSDTNNGTGVFTYYPDSNIDTTVTATNTAVADDPSSVVTDAVTIAKGRTTSIDEAGNALSNQATIGEVITYTVTVDIPEGTTVGNASIVDDLPSNLGLIVGAGTPSATFTGVGGDGAVTVSLTAGSDPVIASLNDTDYTNPPGSGVDRLTLTITARVLDVPTNNHGVTIGNTATFGWDNHDTPTPIRRTRSASVNTSVVEPDIGVVKASVDSVGNDDVVVGGETVTYTVTVSNAAGTSTAHDLVVVDTLPEGVTPTFPIPNSGVWVADGTPGDGVGGTITWNITSLAPDSSTALTYAVVVDDPIVVSTALTNTVVVDATSQAEPSTGERSAGTRYTATDNDTQTSPLASIDKSVTPSSATIGEVVTYEIDVTIPPGTIMYDATIIDTLPPGVAYDGMVGVSSCAMNASICDPDITATDIGVVGSQAVGFWLDDIDVASTTGETRVVTITYRAHVLPTANRGDTPDNSAVIWGNQTDKITVDPTTPPATGGFDVSEGPAVASFTVVEPTLSIDKDVVARMPTTTGDVPCRGRR